MQSVVGQTRAGSAGVLGSSSFRRRLPIRDLGAVQLRLRGLCLEYISPELGRCARRIEQCPGLGEIGLFERRIALILAQHPALGGIRLFARAWAPAFSQVDALPFSPTLPSRDLARPFFSQAETLWLGRPKSPSQSRSFLPSRDFVPAQRKTRYLQPQFLPVLSLRFVTDPDSRRA